MRKCGRKVPRQRMFLRGCKSLCSHLLLLCVLASCCALTYNYFAFSRFIANLNQKLQCIMQCFSLGGSAGNWEAGCWRTSPRRRQSPGFKLGHSCQISVPVFNLFCTKLVLTVVNETEAHLSLSWDVASWFIFEALIWKNTELPCTHNKQPENSYFPNTRSSPSCSVFSNQSKL